MEGEEEQNRSEEDEEIDTETKTQGAGRHLSPGWGEKLAYPKTWDIGVQQHSPLLATRPPPPPPRGMFRM